MFDMSHLVIDLHEFQYSQHDHDTQDVNLFYSRNASPILSAVGILSIFLLAIDLHLFQYSQHDNLISYP